MVYGEACISRWVEIKSFTSPPTVTVLSLTHHLLVMIKAAQSSPDSLCTVNKNHIVHSGLKCLLILTDWVIFTYYSRLTEIKPITLQVKTSWLSLRDPRQTALCLRSEGNNNHWTVQLNYSSACEGMNLELITLILFCTFFSFHFIYKAGISEYIYMHKKTYKITVSRVLLYILLCTLFPRFLQNIVRVEKDTVLRVSQPWLQRMAQLKFGRFLWAPARCCPHRVSLNSSTQIKYRTESSPLYVAWLFIIHGEYWLLPSNVQRGSKHHLT